MEAARGTHTCEGLLKAGRGGAKRYDRIANNLSCPPSELCGQQRAVPLEASVLAGIWASLGRCHAQGRGISIADGRCLACDERDPARMESDCTHSNTCAIMPFQRFLLSQTHGWSRQSGSWPW
eukprot:scaffold1926_cov122-Isochrysis_galbana.AAC.9